MLVSLAIIGTVGAFGAQKFLVMKEYGDTRHQKIIHENELEGKMEKFSMTNFGIAVMVTNSTDRTIVDLTGHYEWSILSF